jgi:hypothetical protein
MTTLLNPLTPTESASPTAERTKVAFVGCLPGVELPQQLQSARLGLVDIERVREDKFEKYLGEFPAGDSLAAVFAGSEFAVPESIVTLRRLPSFARTRAYVVGKGAGGPVPGWTETYDIEDILSQTEFDGFGLSDKVDMGLRAYCSLIHDSLYTDYYLDMTFNKIFDWFETTRWDWKDINLDDVNRELLSPDEVDYLTVSAIMEFGTLPGAHNFLREWEGETSFSSWALMWGAEEARHSLVQARYLDKIGVKVRSKHALYKREPYPMGDTQTGTLVMNIISEARASELYKQLAAHTQEPVIKRIWKLLSHDESRHCRAFYVFSKELCEESKANQVEALRMGYIWLADRSRGLKHPAGHFYPHSTSTSDIRRAEAGHDGATDAADARVMSILRRLAADDSIETTRDIKRKLKSLM